MVVNSAVLQDRVETGSYKFPIYKHPWQYLVGWVGRLGNLNLPQAELKTYSAFPAAVDHAVNLENEVANEQKSSSLQLEAMLKDRRWVLINNPRFRERLVMEFLEALGYHNLSGTYNLKGYTYVKEGRLVTKIDFEQGFYIPLNGSLPHEVIVILKKAGICPK